MHLSCILHPDVLCIASRYLFGNRHLFKFNTGVSPTSSVGQKLTVILRDPKQKETPSQKTGKAIRDAGPTLPSPSVTAGSRRSLIARQAYWKKLHQSFTPGFILSRSFQHFKGEVFSYSPARSVNWPAASKARSVNP